MTAHRHALPGGVEIGLGGNGILKVTEVIALVREQLDERSPEIGRVAFDPRRVAPAEVAREVRRVDRPVAGAGRAIGAAAVTVAVSALLY